MLPALTTERLLLRHFTLDDTEAMFQLLRDPDVNRFLPLFPPKSLQEVSEILKGYLEDNQQPDRCRYAICWRTGGAPIGYIHISGADGYDLGYALQKKSWRQGIITEAGKAVIEQARREGFPYLTATHDIKNPGSGRVMQKLGMTYRYSYEERWQPKNQLVLFRMYQINLDEGHTGTYEKYWKLYPNHFIEKALLPPVRHDK